MNVDINNDTAGVSPVIGVVLMVAITVILAAVVGSFALGLVGGQDQNANAAVSFEQSPHDPTQRTNVTSTDTDGDGSDNDVSVTVQAVTIQNAELVRLQYDGQGETFTDSNGDTKDVVTESSGSELQSAGESTTLNGLDSGDRVTVVGVLDGKETVLQTFTAE